MHNLLFIIFQVYLFHAQKGGTIYLMGILSNFINFDRNEIITFMSEQFYEYFHIDNNYHHIDIILSN